MADKFRRVIPLKTAESSGIAETCPNWPKPASVSSSRRGLSLKQARGLRRGSKCSMDRHGALPYPKSRGFRSGPRYVRQGDRLSARAAQAAVPIRPVVPGTARDASLCEPVRPEPSLDPRGFLRYSNIRRSQKRLGDIFRGRGGVCGFGGLPETVSRRDLSAAHAKRNSSRNSSRSSSGGSFFSPTAFWIPQTSLKKRSVRTAMEIPMKSVIASSGAPSCAAPRMRSRRASTSGRRVGPPRRWLRGSRRGA